MKNNELKILVPKDWSIAEEKMPDGSRVLKFTPVTAESSTRQLQEGIFKRVPASELRLDDDFLNYQPKNFAENNLKCFVQTAIKNGLKDFWRPVYDPSFDDNGCICYHPGNMPAVGKSYNWWYKHAKAFCPERGSRLGTNSEYGVFLAVLIKELVASGKSVEWAWNAVCNNSKELGHYWESKDAKHDFETTGSRDICGWYDLANTYKILADDEEVDVYYYLVGGKYEDYSNNYPLAIIYRCKDRDADFCFSCGWLVLETD